MNNEIPIELSPCPECQEQDYHAESCSMFVGEKTHWVGETPTQCDLCGHKIENAFVDGKTQHGPWCIMCPVCCLVEGVGLGEGKGQLYANYLEGENKGKFVKVRG